MQALRIKLWSIGVALSIAGGSAALLMTGCEGLDYSARGEGTGIQIIGAIVVLAKYHASPQQKTLAEQKARAAYASQAKPDYEKRRATVQADSRKKAAALERDYGRRIAQAPKEMSAAANPASSAALLEQEQKQALARLQSEAAAELASVDSAWRSLGGGADHSIKGANSSQAGIVPTGSTRDREAIIASASAHLPGYIAVSVPAQGHIAEKGGKATIMLWDTRRQRLASDDVLVLDRKPAAGNDAKVDGVIARFAGN
jgi:hypothetical protein